MRSPAPAVMAPRLPHLYSFRTSTNDEPSSGKGYAGTGKDGVEELGNSSRHTCTPDEGRECREAHEDGLERGLVGLIGLTGSDANGTAEDGALEHKVHHFVRESLGCRAGSSSSIGSSLDGSIDGGSLKLTKTKD